MNTSSESLNDKNPVSDSIHQLAGPELRDELLKLKGREKDSQETRAALSCQDRPLGAALLQDTTDQLDCVCVCVCRMPDRRG